MGRTGSWILAAAVGALAAAAVVDGVVGGGSPAEPPSPPPPPSPQRETEPPRDAFLTDEAVGGRLLYVDEGCRVRTLDLPQAASRETPGRVACAFTSSPGAVLGVDGAFVSPRLHPQLSGFRLGAVCTDGHVEVRPLSGGEIVAPLLGASGSRVQRVRGCGPAWRPDGTLTLVRDGEVVDAGEGGTDPPRTILSRRDLARAFAGPPWSLGDTRVREIAWLDDRLLAAVVRGGADEEDLLALFRGRRLVATTPSPYEELAGIRVSPGGTYVAARVGDAPALVLLDREGEFVPSGLRGHAISWSRDERFAAIAASDAIYVFEAGGRASRFARIPIHARDVFWR